MNLNFGSCKFASRTIKLDGLELDLLDINDYLQPDNLIFLPKLALIFMLKSSN